MSGERPGPPGTLVPAGAARSRRIVAATNAARAARTEENPMRQLTHHPLRTLAGLLALAFVLFMLSGIPALKDAKHGVYLVLGDICWFGFLLTALVFVVSGLFVLARLATRSRRTA
jgi:hypothetical protein